MSRAIPITFAVTFVALASALPAALPQLPDEIADPDFVVDEAPETLLPELFAVDNRAGEDDFEESMADEDEELVQAGAQFGFNAFMKGLGLKDANAPDYGYGYGGKPAEPAAKPASKPAAKPAGSARAAGSGFQMGPVTVPAPAAKPAPPAKPSPPAKPAAPPAKPAPVTYTSGYTSGAPAYASGEENEADVPKLFAGLTQIEGEFFK
jgi:hypothetical protein